MTRISFIGLGGMSRAIASRALANGHTVELVGRDGAKVADLAAELGSGAATGAFGAVPSGDLVVLAVPYTSAVEVVSHYGDALAGKIVVDISNTFTADATDVLTTDGTSGAQLIAAAAPSSANIVKAFNTAFGHVLAQGGPLDVLIAGDDAGSKSSVSEFVASLGLRPLDVGDLAASRWLEAVGPLLMGLAGHGAGFGISLHIDGVN